MQFNNGKRIKRIGLIWLACAFAVVAAAQSTEVVLHNFGSALEGAAPLAGVIRDPAGNLYGTTSWGGTAGLGVVYKIDPAGRQTVLHNFTGAPDGAYPYASVIRDSAGNLYGTTYAGGPANAGVIYKIATSGKETVLYSFAGGSDGANPHAGVIRDSAGNLYGTTEFGANGGGVVYKLDPSGHETVLHSFVGGFTDGSEPFAGVVRDPAGNLYGTTTYGGSGYGGTVYKIDATGHETVLYNFTGGPDGANPYGGVVLDSAGNLYGTTVVSMSGGGVVYKLDPSGNHTVLYTFTNGTDGDDPEAGVIRDSDGNLYGTTVFGGPANSGVVYKVDPTGHETVLYGFAGGADGANPYAGIVRDSSGNLYGASYEGGAANAGLAFMLDSTGHKTNLYSFPGMADGAFPEAGVIRDSSGNLYGTTVSGGTANSGVVFKVDATGHETVLYTFTGGADGANPYAGVVRDSSGNLYGTTFIGGASNAGVVQGGFGRS